MSPSTDPTSMEARYKLELNDRDPSTVIDLILDNCSASTITGLSDNLTNLQSLSIINAGLESLDGLPFLPSLSKLDLSNNNITGGLEILSKNCPELLHLNLSGNSVESVEEFKVLNGTKVAEIDIFSNPLSADESHRENLFKLVENLQILDGCDVNGDEIEDEDNSLAGEDSDDDIITDEEDMGDEDEFEDGPGLSYLQKSHFSDDEEDDEYDPESRKTKKRGAGDADEEDEPPAKKDA